MQQMRRGDPRQRVLLHEMRYPGSVAADSRRPPAAGGCRSCRAEKEKARRAQGFGSGLFDDGALDGLDFDFDDIGSWWGSDSRTHKEAEVDIVCVRSNATIAMGECKWRAEAFQKDELEKLMGRAVLVNAVPDVRYYAFSRSGFTAGCFDIAQGSSSVRLVGFEDMVDSAAS